MAAAIVSNFANDLLETLESLEMSEIWDSRIDVFGEMKSMKELKKELQEVKKKIKDIKDVLLDAEKKQSSSLAVRGWLEKLGDVLLAADDLVDEIRYQKNALGPNPDHALITKVRLLVSSAYRLARLSSDVRRVSEIRQNLVSIVDQKPRIGSNEEINVVKQTCFQVPLEVVGRAEEKEDIIKLLQVPPSRPLSNTDIIPSSPMPQPATNMSNISAIAIVGVPGSGKTTLAQSICNDGKVELHFDHRIIWACVSDLLSFSEILTRIIESASGGKDSSVPSLKPPRDQLSEEISGKKYLLVLDDMSTNDQFVWDSLRALLDTGAPGSKILITTRYQNVGMAVATADNIYKLGSLSDNDGWLLFKKFAFSGSEDQEQEQFGKDIVRMCENFPLILRLAANHLAQKNNWQQLRVEKLDIMDMFTRHQNRLLLNVLRPSYDQLNPHLKHCVAYCSLFPRDYEFSKQSLIQMWMAQGFLKPEDSSNNSLEDIGERQFQILRRMSFFQDVKLDALGEIKTCRMRKMFHHLAQNEAEGGCVVDSGITKFNNRTLHVSIKFTGSFPDALFTAQKLRTLLCHKDSECGVKLSQSICQMMLFKFKRLRTLNLDDCGIDVLPDNVGDLIHLRFLDLSKNYSLVALPESITKLRNLQVLNLNLCQKLKRLPRSMGKLAMLRCLEIEECDSLTFMPQGLEKLVALQSLNRFVVCLPSKANKDSGGIRVLENLNSLRGRLKVELSGQWTEEVNNAPLANLKDKCNLTDLKVEWRLGILDNTRTCHYYEAFLESLHPPSGLKVLCVEGYEGRDFPGWATEGRLARLLPHLVIVSIEGCKECKQLPAFGELEHLKSLTLRNMEGVEYMVDDIYDPVEKPTQLSLFKSLKELTLHSFYSLKGWWKGAEVTKEHGLPKVTEKHGLPSLPQLSKLRIWNCPKLTSMPVFNQVEEVDFQDVNQKLLEIFSVKVVAPTPPSSISNVHETLTDFSYDQSSSTLSYGLLQKLKKLKTLHIKACPKMQSFPTVWDENIQSLVIDNCDELTSVANGMPHLKSLETLEISYCNKLNFWDDVHGFTWAPVRKLRVLTFRGISKMKTFPEGLKMIKTVQEFHITRCSELSALPEWIDQMSSLRHLRLEACPNLTRLPQGRNCLLGLDKLEIMECPQLMERCREGGDDRCKIKPHAQVLLHKSWRYGLANNAERTSEAMPSQFTVDDTTVTLARTDKGSSWEELTFKSKIKVVK